MTAGPSIWRNRDFRLVWSGQALSEFGNGVSQLAYPLLMLALTGSPTAAGALAAVRAVPYLLFGLVAGALADRWNRKRTMIACDLARAVNMATIPVALALGVLTPVHVFVAGFLGGVLYVFFNAAEGACLPNVVRKEQLTAAVSAQGTAQSACGVVAGPIGGVLLQFARGLPFLVDALSFLVSALCLAFVRTDFRDGDSPSAGSTPRGSLRAEVVAGVRWLWNHAALRLIALTAAGLQLAISGVTLVAIVVVRDSGASSATIGVLFSALGIGGVIGALVAPRLKDRLGLGGLLLSVLWLQGALWVVPAFSTAPIVVGVVLALFSVSMPCFGIAALSFQLEVTPDHLRGRVGTAFSLLIWAAVPVGGAAVGVLLDLGTPRATSLVFAAWVVGLSVVATGTGRLRALDRPPADASTVG
ncbi:MFS transporter [Actinosynnema sp. NPDC047251]|uniref:MFS transporter n=1 Tax=Saccharothrix espanaensis TaxID=103731 RepID=UPI0002D4C242|nr:MFS transporter [Saccharothrix espanaensis]